MKKKYILFDLDGTLTDPALGITNSILHAIQKLNLENKKREELYVFIGPPLHQSFMEFFNLSSIEADNAVEAYREYFSVKGLFENEPYPYVHDALAYLKQQGYQIGLATSKPEIYAVQILEKFDLAKYFDIIKGSRLNDRSENKTRIMKEAMDYFKDDDLSQFIMVGDRKFDIEGAHTNQIDSIGVTFGYGSKEELQNANCTYIINSLNELKNIL